MERVVVTTTVPCYAACSPVWPYRRSGTAMTCEEGRDAHGDRDRQRRGRRKCRLAFACWESWLRGAGLCASLSDVDFIEIHAFGCQPKSPSPLTDPQGHAAEGERLKAAYAEAYRDYFAVHLPDHGLPCRFTVQVVDVPDQAASCEFFATALLRRGRQAR